MTREEAIRTLIDLQDGNGDVYEAIRMAIEALSSYDELYKKAKEVNDMANEILDDFPSYKEALSKPSIVRCKDCRWWSCQDSLYQRNSHLCRYWKSTNTGAEDFCSYGEKKE